MKIRRLLPALLLVFGLAASAQTTPEEAMSNLDFLGGVYYAYPVSSPQKVTAPPKGYKPFYISHYGRHGSRYLISDNDYINFLRPMRKAKAAGKLTPQGEQVLELAEQVWLEANGRGGELTPLGTRQHKGIAQRMYKAYPEVFAGNPELTAASTVVMRCAQSMDAFAEGLKELNPTLQIPREASQRNMYYLNHHTDRSNHYCSTGTWREAKRKFEQQQIKPERLMTALFNDPEYVYYNINPEELMWQLYWLTVDQQNIETPGSFYGVLTPQEMFDIWQIVNFDNYVRDANHPGSGGLVVANAANLLENILTTADDIVARGANGATLRFGHDGNLMPLASILRIEGTYDDKAVRPEDAYKSYANWKISPMAANVQMVFFRDKKGDVIVKFLLNEQEVAIPVETDMFPFYSWPRVREYYRDVLKYYRSI